MSTTNYLSFITCIIMTACSEEDSPLLFSVESVSNPENVIMEYYSPEPSYVSKRYWIFPSNATVRKFRTVAFEMVTKIPAHMWLRHQKSYDEFMARKR